MHAATSTRSLARERARISLLQNIECCIRATCVEGCPHQPNSGTSTTITSSPTRPLHLEERCECCTPAPPAHPCPACLLLRTSFYRLPSRLAPHCCLSPAASSCRFRLLPAHAHIVHAPALLPGYGQPLRKGLSTSQEAFWGGQTHCPVSTSPGSLYVGQYRQLGELTCPTAWLDPPLKPLLNPPLPDPAVALALAMATDCSGG